MRATDLSVYTFTVLRRRLEQERRAYYRRLRGKRSNKLRRADEYALGWVFSVAQEVERFARPVPEEVTVWLERHGSGRSLEPRDRGRDRDHRHLYAGFADGADVELQHGVGAVSSRLSLNS